MDVLIVGAGSIGLTVAWRALGNGMSVTLVDPAPASKASHVSAGILPAGTAGLYDPPQAQLLELCLTSRTRWPSFVAELEEASGRSAGYRRDGVLEVGYTEADVQMLNGLADFQDGRGMAVQRLTAQECLEQEPSLSPEVSGGLLNPDDGAVDPRTLNAAMLAAVQRLGGVLVPQPVAEVLLESRPFGVRLADGQVLRGDQLVLAAGPWTSQLPGLPPGLVPEIKPEKGQVVRLRSDQPLLRRATRGFIDGHSILAVQRADGELAVGATHERCGYDTAVTADGLWELLDQVRRLVPGIGGLSFVEASAGLRPGSPDGKPVLGMSRIDGVILATGHGRIGIQLTPATGDVLAELLVKGELPTVALPFSPLRF
jgi:glycine oxidase